MKRYLKHVFLGCLFFISAISCTKNSDKQTLFQVSPIDALLQGVYDGSVTLEQISKKGDFGIGTVNSLDGELILVDGIFYQVRSDGKIYLPERNVKTPFATVTFFENESNYVLNNINYNSFKLKADGLMETGNLFAAIYFKGDFKSVKTRSVPVQSKPYPDLVEVAKNQPEFEAQNISGQLIGFYSPEYVKGINIPGYHLHFLADDKSFGGHVLDFELISGSLVIDKINHFEMLLPTEGDFLKSEFSTDRSEELKKVEQ